MRNMSFWYTYEKMLARMKPITRRIGWWFLESGDLVMAVRKGMGLKKGEKIERLYPIQILSTRAEPLRKMIDDLEYGYREVVLEGFPHMTPKEFVDFFCDSHKCLPEKVINRIEFKEAPAWKGQEHT